MKRAHIINPVESTSSPAEDNSTNFEITKMMEIK
jgi:hypothetical protein